MDYLCSRGGVQGRIWGLWFHRRRKRREVGELSTKPAFIARHLKFTLHTLPTPFFRPITPSVLRFVITVFLLHFLPFKKSLLALPTPLCVSCILFLGTLDVSLKNDRPSNEFFDSFNIQQIFVEFYVAGILPCFWSLCYTWRRGRLHKL